MQAALTSLARSVLDEFGEVRHAGSMQQLPGGGRGHAEEEVFAEGGPNAQQGIHASLAGQGLQDVGHVRERHCQQQLPLVLPWQILHITHHLSAQSPGIRDPQVSE